MNKLLLLSILFLVACQDKPKVGERSVTLTLRKTDTTTRIEIVEPEESSEFHVRVYQSMGLYFVQVTNDDWATKEGVLSCYKNQIMGVTSFDTEEEALKVARKFNTYDDFVKYNERVKQRCGAPKVIYVK